MQYKVISKTSYEYTGSSQQIELEKGNYLIELFGAQGGCDSSIRCLGGYSSAHLTVQSTQNLLLYIGGKGEFTGLQFFFLIFFQ